MHTLFQKSVRTATAVILGMTLVSGCDRKAPTQSPGAAATPLPSVSPSVSNDQRVAARLKIQEGLRAQLKRDFRTAIRLFEEAMKADSTIVGANYQIAVCQMNLGDQTLARTYAYRSIGRNESVAPAYVLVGTMAARVQNFGEAEWAFNRATMAAPADPIAYYNWSEALRAEGKFAEAIQKLRAAVGRDPGEPLYALKLRLTRIQAGEAQTLVPDVDRELARKPPSADWQMTAAAIALKVGKYQDAASILNGVRQNMQPILFYGLIQDDPFLSQFKHTPEIAPFYDVTISVATPTPAEKPKTAP